MPFLDKTFLDVAMDIDPAEKMIDKSKGEGTFDTLVQSSAKAVAL